MCQRFVVLAIAWLMACGSLLHAEQAADLFSVATGHYRQHRWEQAITDFQEFVEKFPQHEQTPSAMMYLAESLMQQASHEEARGWFLKILQRDPEPRFTRQANFRIGEASYLAGKFMDARRELDGFRDQYPDDELNAYTLPYLADIATEAGETAAAMALYSTALEQFPEGPMREECHFGIAQLLQREGQFDAALEKYQKLADGAGKLAEQARLQIGIVQYNRGQYALAERAFRQFLFAHNDSDLRAHAQYWQGMSQIAQQNWREALSTLKTARREHPQHALTPAMVYWSAECLRHVGQREEAAEAYRQLVENWPTNLWADDSLLALTQIAFDRGEFARVDAWVEAFRQARMDSPLWPQLHQLRGRALLKRERYAEAIRWWDEASGAPPMASDTIRLSDLPPAPDAGSHSPAIAIPPHVAQTNRYYLGLALLGDKQYPRALRVLGEVQPQPEQHELHDGVQVATARALMGLERYAEAISPLQRYLLSQPNGPDAPQCRVQLVLALARSNRLNEALALHARLSEADQQVPLYGDTTLHLAELLYRGQQYQPAYALYTVLAARGRTREHQVRGLSGTAWCAQRNGETAIATAKFQQLMQHHPDHELAAEAAWMSAKALEQANHTHEALQAYLWLVNHHGQSKWAPAGMYEAARLLEKYGHKAEAIAMLEKLVHGFSKFEQRDAAIYQLAWLLAETGHDEQADGWFQKLADDGGRGKYWADATYRLAERAARQQQTDRAVELSERLIDARCDSSILEHALYLRGQLAATSQQWREAYGWMARLVELFPKSELSVPAQYWLAEAAYQIDRFDEAGQRFAWLSRATTGRHDAWLAMIPLRQSQMLIQQEKWDEAERIASTIRPQFPNFRQHYEADYVLGRCLASTGRWDEARELYQRVIDSEDGGNTETAAMAQWMIGESYFHQQQYDLAIRAYHRVNALFPYPRWKVVAILQTAKCHELKGQQRQAIQLYQQLVTEHADSPLAAEATQRLKELSDPPTTATLPATESR